jgi:hypothetical protein
MGTRERYQCETKEGAIVVVPVELERVGKVLPRRGVVSDRVHNLRSSITTTERMVTIGRQNAACV